MASHRWPSRTFTDGGETFGRTDYEDGESDSSRASGLRDECSDPALCSLRRTYGAAREGAELAEVRSGDRGSRGWVRDTFDRWDSMVDEYEVGTAGGAGESDHPEAESGGRPFEGDRPAGGHNRAGTVAPQTLNATRDVYKPLTQDARGGGNIANVPVDIKLNLGKETLTLVYVTSILAGFSIAFSVLTFFYLHDQMLRDQRSSEQMRVQVLSQNAILQREGFIKPGDEWMGPEGNLQFNPELLRRK